MNLNVFISILLFILLIIFTNYKFEDFYVDEQEEEENDIKYFELNNEAKNLINSYKHEEKLREIVDEKKQMKNNVQRIVDHAENVLDFTELNKEYFEKIYLKQKKEIK